MRALRLLGLLVLLIPVPAVSQYLFLDTNGDGVHDASDQLAPSGPTSVDVYLVTNQNRDGTPVTCVDDPGTALTVSSYSFVLHSVGGSVKWGPMQNRLPFTAPMPACFATYADTTDADWYHNGWGWMDQFSPGKHRLATLQIEVTSGSPSIFFEPYLPRRVVQITAFGTPCMGYDGDNTYKLGSEFHDADGLGPLRAYAAGPYEVQAGRILTVDGSGSRSMLGGALTYAWDFGDGGTATTAVADHIYQTPGDYRLLLTATDLSGSATDTTNVHVVAPAAPFAKISGPNVAYVGVPAEFDGSRSYDVDGDALRYQWDFGDNSGPVPDVKSRHTYTAAGSYTVTLLVMDGILNDTATHPLSVYAVPHPPVAAAGGPYSGIIGRLIQFNGTGSSDPDNDPLTYSWSFGDRRTSTGPAAAHVYDAPGVYNVVLTVSDGGLTSTSTTTATVREFLAARAFVPGGAVYTPGQSDPMTVHLEPVEGSFRTADVDPWPLTLSSPGTGVMDAIASVADVTPIADSDGNHVAELTFQYSPQELELLFRNATNGATVTATIKGDFLGGGYLQAQLPIQIGAGENARAGLRISPNPFNPQAVVSFNTSRAGAVGARLFDVKGRLVRTIQYGVMQPGRHVLSLDARGDDGVVLASGIYFFRLSGPDGITTRRVAVAK